MAAMAVAKEGCPGKEVVGRAAAGVGVAAGYGEKPEKITKKYVSKITIRYKNGFQQCPLFMLH